MKQSQVLITASDLLKGFFLGSFPESGLYFGGGGGWGFPLGVSVLMGGGKKS